MPVIAAILGAIASGVFLWVVWGNGMQVIHAWLDQRGAKTKAQKDAKAIADARDRAARAPLRAIEDVREAALVLLCKLATARGEMTAEQRAAIRELAEGRLGFTGKLENQLALAEFAAKSVAEPTQVVADLTPLLHVRLTAEEKDDLVQMLDSIAAIHGGPTGKQEEMIERLHKRLGLARRDAPGDGAAG